MRRIPSLDQLIAAASAAFLRFPETVTVGGLCAAVGMAAVASEAAPREHTLELLATLALGIPLTFAIAGAIETGVVPRRARPLAMLSVVLALVLLFTGSIGLSSELFAIRIALLALAAHLLVAFLPYLGRGSDDAFWDYNQGLLARFLLAAVYSGVLFVGLAIALGTVQALFSLHVPFEVYARLWIVMAFVFNTWLFCGMVDRPLPQGAPSFYPRPLRVLTQYILIPLVTLYLLILYGDIVQIAIRRSWPQGTVGYLVSGFSVVGMLALLFIHPLRETSENRWVRVYARRFYFSLFPLVGLLMLGTWRRVSEYGITEKRYLLIALGLWIAGVALAFVTSRRRDIRVIPVSLCAVALLASFGPWSASNISRADQIARLRGILVRRGLLAGGKVRPARAEVDFATRQAISAGLDYLNRVHHGTGVKSWFDAEALRPPSGAESPTALSTPRMMNAMGLAYVGRWQTQGSEGFSLSAHRDPHDDSLVAIPLDGYPGMVMISLYRYTGKEPPRTLWLGDRRFSLELEDSGDLRVWDDSASVSIPLARLASRLRMDYPTPMQGPSSAEMTTEALGLGLDAKLVLTSMIGRVRSPGAATRDPAELQVQQVDGTLFLRPR